jgi:hypothetical protein
VGVVLLLAGFGAMWGWGTLGGEGTKMVA